MEGGAAEGSRVDGHGYDSESGLRAAPKTSIAASSHRGNLAASAGGGGSAISSASDGGGRDALCATSSYPAPAAAASGTDSLSGQQGQPLLSMNRQMAYHLPRASTWRRLQFYHAAAVSARRLPVQHPRRLRRLPVCHEPRAYRRMGGVIAGVAARLFA